jgi:hypothetical protein
MPPSTHRSTPSSTAHRLLAIATVGATLAAGDASGQSAGLLRTLNEPAAKVTDANKSAERLFTAYLDLTRPPQPIGDDFNMLTIYPGMDGWDEVARWAEANESMGKTLVAIQECQLIGLPYGDKGVDPKFIERGIVAEIGVDGDLSRLRFGYLDAIRAINAYAVADMYRLCEAGRFDDAFRTGIAHLRMLRQGCDAQMFDEKTAFMTMLSDALSVHRDVLWAYRSKLPWRLLKRLGQEEYPFLRASDNERLKRIAMPEGDIAVAREMIESVFDGGGQPDGERFARTFASLQSKAAPLTAFGATKRWDAIAEVHSSLDASEQKLTDVYDDWWRRWRMRPYDPMQALPTELSRTNPVRYAAVTLAARDIDSLFELRRRLVTELCGTVVSCGLTAYRAQFGTWPNDIEKAYAMYFPKRFDFDPYDRGEGPFLYQELGTKTKAVDSEFGTVEISGCLLYGRNNDGEFNGALRHAAGGDIDDFVIWPPLRAVSRGQGE